MEGAFPARGLSDWLLAVSQGHPGAGGRVTGPFTENSPPGKCGASLPVGHHRQLPGTRMLKGGRGRPPPDTPSRCPTRPETTDSHSPAPHSRAGSARQPRKGCEDPRESEGKASPHSLSRCHPMWPRGRWHSVTPVGGRKAELASSLHLDLALRGEGQGGATVTGAHRRPPTPGHCGVSFCGGPLGVGAVWLPFPGKAEGPCTSPGSGWEGGGEGGGEKARPAGGHWAGRAPLQSPGPRRGRNLQPPPPHMVPA